MLRHDLIIFVQFVLFVSPMFYQCLRSCLYHYLICLICFRLFAPSCPNFSNLTFQPCWDSAPEMQEQRNRYGSFLIDATALGGCAKPFSLSKLISFCAASKHAQCFFWRLSKTHIFSLTTRVHCLGPAACM